MKYVSLPDNDVRPLPFYLTMEEYVARRFSDEIFFMWQVNPTVIFGRNQLIDNEVNLSYCRDHGIEFYRRKSGGGCVYADMDNIMFSYIVSGDDVVTTFSDYTGRVAECFADLELTPEAAAGMMSPSADVKCRETLFTTYRDVVSSTAPCFPRHGYCPHVGGNIAVGCKTAVEGSGLGEKPYNSVA